MEGRERGGGPYLSWRGAQSLWVGCPSLPCPPHVVLVSPGPQALGAGCTC